MGSTTEINKALFINANKTVADKNAAKMVNETLKNNVILIKLVSKYIEILTIAKNISSLEQNERLLHNIMVRSDKLPRSDSTKELITRQDSVRELLKQRHVNRDDILNELKNLLDNFHRTADNIMAMLISNPDQAHNVVILNQIETLKNNMKSFEVKTKTYSTQYAELQTRTHELRDFYTKVSGVKIDERAAATQPETPRITPE